MKRLLLMLAICLGLSACGNGTVREHQSVAEQPGHDRVEILYFHGKQRCATCLAIEKNTEEALHAQFADELKAGTLVFRCIDISEKENEKMADKYQVTWSSLFVCKWEGGEEKYENLTKFAFGSARTDPEAFKSGLTEKVGKWLK